MLMLSCCDDQSLAAYISDPALEQDEPFRGLFHQVYNGPAKNTRSCHQVSPSLQASKLVESKIDWDYERLLADDSPLVTKHHDRIPRSIRSIPSYSHRLPR